MLKKKDVSMPKILVYLFLTVLSSIVILGVNAVTAYASTIIDSGSCSKDSDNLVWTLDDEGLLTISGNGEMPSYDYDVIFGEPSDWYETDAPWFGKTIKNVVIEPGVTSISDCAFLACNHLKSVTIPDTVTYVGERAFSYCKSLEKIILPDSVTVLGYTNHTFSGCSNLKSVVLSTSLTEIGWGTFEGSGLRSIVIPSNITCIDREAFYYCRQLKNIYFAGSAPIIESNSFEGVSATAFYPEGDSSWTEVIIQERDGNITWVPYDSQTLYINRPDESFWGKVNIEKHDKMIMDGNAIIIRSDGESRYITAIETADNLKLVLNKEEYDTIIVAASHSFPDALSGSYLAAKKKAPILIIRSNEKNDGLDKVIAYIRNNLSASGQVYILGGTAAVSEVAETAISRVTSKVTRLAGKNRYWTNRAILMEAGISDGEDLIIADANSFADALSASALGKPILLINKENDLSVEQEVFLSGRKIGHVYLLGGENAVHDSIRNDLAEVLPGVPVTRIGGATRYETSAMIAKTFFPNPDVVTLATGVNFPDGLTGGSLAYALKAPLVLTRDKEADIKTAADYVKPAGASNFLAFGGTSALKNETIAAIAGK